MRTLIDIAKVTALTGVTFLCFSAGIVILRVGASVNTIAAQADAQLLKLDKTQQAVDKLLVDTKRLIIHADITEVKENATLDTFNNELKTTLLHVDQSVTALTANENQVSGHLVQTIDSATQTLQSTRPVVANLQTSTAELNQNLASLQVTEQDLNALISDPHIKDSITQTDAILTSGKHIAADGEHMVHSYVYPKPIVTVVDWTLKVVHAINPF